MSGRTFTYQGGFDDFVLTLLPDIGQSERRKSVGVGDSMLREIEEFLNRFCVTATNDDGDVTFDAAGTYTFLGDVDIQGNLTISDDLQSSNWSSTTAGWKLFQTGAAEFNDDLNVGGNVTLGGDGLFRSSSGGHRIEMGDEEVIYVTETYRRINFYSDHADEDDNAWIGVSDDSGFNVHLLILGPEFDGTGARSGIYLYGQNGTYDSTIEAFGEFLNFTADDAAVFGLNDLQTEISFSSSGGIRIGGGLPDVTISADDLDVNVLGLADFDGDVRAQDNLYLGTTLDNYFSVVSDDIQLLMSGTRHFTFTEEGQLKIESRLSGWTDQTDMHTKAGLFLVSGGMNTLSKFTPAVVFGSTDSDFTSENPKALAAIQGLATQTYNFNAAGGMSLIFSVSQNAPGTNDVLSLNSKGYVMSSSAFYPRQDNAYDLGLSGLRYDDVYATNGTIQTSDLREKTLLPDEQLGWDFMRQLTGIAFHRSGGTRIHHGVAAQTVAAALGPDHAIWVRGDDGRLGMRYDELWGPQINTNHEFDERLRRLEALVG